MIVQNGKNVIKIKPLQGGNLTAPYLRKIVRQLKLKDREAQAIGAKGQALARDVLHPDNM